ncbi:MAG: hypothetical protein WD358_03440 [Nitriliruptoraceae bacterium]
MAAFDRIKRWMRGDQASSAGEAAARSGRGEPAKTGQGRGVPSDVTRDLTEFAKSRRGVEGYVEPRTKMYGTSLLLVADDGEHLRRSIDSPADAAKLCQRLAVPVYDASKVGYPRRMRHYVQGQRPPSVELSELPPWPGDDAPKNDNSGQ